MEEEESPKEADGAKVGSPAREGGNVFGLLTIRLSLETEESGQRDNHRHR